MLSPKTKFQCCLAIILIWLVIGGAMSFQPAPRQGAVVEGRSDIENGFFVWDGQTQTTRQMSKAQAVDFMYAKGYHLVVATEAGTYRHTSLFFEK